MTINVKNLCVALVFAMLAPFQASADEVTDVVNDVAANLVQQLPMDKSECKLSGSIVDTKRGYRCDWSLPIGPAGS